MKEYLRRMFYLLPYQSDYFSTPYFFETTDEEEWELALEDAADNGFRIVSTEMIAL